MNETIKKFGYPDYLLKEYDKWVVLLRPKQVTAGCVVLACKENAESMSEVSQEAFSELPIVTGEIESALKKAFGMEKINYLMLMMVDKQVHFHVIPRYSENKTLGKLTYIDSGWPKHPDMKNVHELSEEDFKKLLLHLKDCW